MENRMLENEVLYGSLVYEKDEYARVEGFE